MNNNFGLSDKDIGTILQILQSVPEVEEAIVFGSRAKGNFKNSSDVDIALKGNHISFSSVSRISYCLNEETAMPYRFDVINYNTLSNNDLKSHINRIGKILFNKNFQSLDNRTAQ